MFGVRSFECLECVSVRIRLLVPMNKGGWRPRVPALADFSSGPSMDLLDFSIKTRSVSAFRIQAHTTSSVSAFLHSGT